MERAINIYYCLVLTTCLGHSQNETKGQEVLETRVNGSRGTFRLGHRGVKR